MLITKRTYNNKFVIGVLVSSDRSGTLQAGKTAAKDIGRKDIDVVKTVAIDPRRKLVERLLKIYQNQNHKRLMLWFHQKILLKT